MTNPVNQELRDFAERLFADEAVVSSESGVPAAFLVCEKLRRPLTTLAGGAGFHSLLLRALTLAKREAPSLDAVQLTADGSLEDGDIEPHLDNRDAEAGTLLIAHVIGLLVTFIGESLTLRLIKDVWPDESFNSLTEEGTAKHEP